MILCMNSAFEGDVICIWISLWIYNCLSIIYTQEVMQYGNINLFYK